MTKKTRLWGSEQKNKGEYIKVSTLVDHFKRLFSIEKYPDVNHATSDSTSDLNSQVPRQMKIFTELDFSINPPMARGEGGEGCMLPPTGFSNFSRE